MYIEQVMDEIKLLGTPDPQKFIPCREEEVHFLAHQVHLSLPIAYKEFLLTMGKGADDFLVGSEFLYQALGRLQEVAKEMLTEDGFPQKLPEDAFVFFMHQGYQFNFFQMSEGDDPAVSAYFAYMDCKVKIMDGYRYSIFQRAMKRSVFLVEAYKKYQILRKTLL